MAGHMAHRSYPTTKGQGFPKERAAVFSAARRPVAEARYSWYKVEPKGAGMSRLTSTSNGAS